MCAKADIPYNQIFPFDNVGETKDIFTKDIEDIIRSMKGQDQKKLLMITNVTNRTLINIATLKYFLKKHSSSGVFITFDRPHYSIKKLLDINNINHDKLTFIDAISLISDGGSGKSNNSILFTNGPHKIPLLEDLVARSYSINGSKNDIDLSELDFIIVDDISALSLYNPKEVVEKFIMDFFANVRSLNTFIVSLALDDNYNKGLHRFIGTHCEKEVLVDKIGSDYTI